MIENLNWTEVIVAGIVLIGTIYGHWKTAQANRDKTIKAVKEEMQTAIQSVKDEVTAIRSESQAKDEEMHAELLVFKQETMNKLELTHKDISTLSDRVEKHNNLIERTYKLEETTAVQKEQIKVANHRIEDLERAAK